MGSGVQVSNVSAYEYIAAENLVKLIALACAFPWRICPGQKVQHQSSVGPVRRFRIGSAGARRHLRRFLRAELSGYDNARNDPADPQCSQQKPW